MIFSIGRVIKIATCNNFNTSWMLLWFMSKRDKLCVQTMFRNTHSLSFQTCDGSRVASQWWPGHTTGRNPWRTRNTFCGTWYLPHSRVHRSMAELCSNFGDSAINMGQIAYFSLRMRKAALFLLPVKNLTSPSCSPAPISYNTREFWRYVNI